MLTLRLHCNTVFITNNSDRNLVLEMSVMQEAPRWLYNICFLNAFVLQHNPLEIRGGGVFYIALETQRYRGSLKEGIIIFDSGTVPIHLGSFCAKSI